MTPETHIHSWKRPFFAASACLFALLMLNDIAVQLEIYSWFKWIDIPFHFLGGFCVGLASIGILRLLFPGNAYLTSHQLLYTVLAVLFVGAVWEFVEAYFDVSVLFGGNFWFDTYKDLLMDTLGGILSYICFHPHKKSQQLLQEIKSQQQ